MKIVMMNGVARVGKTTFATFCEKLQDKTTYISSIDLFKGIALTYYGWDNHKDEKGRKLLSDLKIAAITYNPEFILTLITPFLGVGRKCLIVDNRDISDIEVVYKYYPEELVSVLLTRPNTVVPNNEGDLNVYKYKYDYVINNNGSLNDLQAKAKQFLKDINVIEH